MLKIEYKKIPEHTVNFMKRVVGSKHDYYNDAVNKMKTELSSPEVHILNSANSCIFTIVEALPEPILIPNEGGWNGLQKSAKILNKEVREIDTDDGIINIERLSEYIESNDIGSLYITSLAGYTAEQPIKEIFELCNLHEIIFILDISGSVGNTKLPNRKYADIEVSSTGSPKIINIENGGFILNITQKIKLNKHLLKTFKADNITCAGIYENLDYAPKILEKTMNTNMYLKEKLVKELEEDKTHNIIHENSNGLNTIITEESKSKAKKLSYNIRKQLGVTNNKSIITTGPNYNRLKRPCVCIEIKNIDEKSLNKENMDKLIEIILQAIKT